MEERSEMSGGGRVARGPEMLESDTGRKGSGGDTLLDSGAAWPLLDEIPGRSFSFWALGEGVRC